MAFQLRFRAIIAIVSFVMIAGLLPSAALGLVSRYERNYSEDYNSARSITVCDGEPDGDPAYALYVALGTTRRVDDGNGSYSGCGGQSAGGRISQHRVCEGVWGNDPCGKWVYP